MGFCLYYVLVRPISGVRTDKQASKEDDNFLLDSSLHEGEHQKDLHIVYHVRELTC